MVDARKRTASSRKPPRVWLAIHTWGGVGRFLIDGVIDYARRNGPWEFLYLASPGVDPQLAHRFASADGVIMLGVDRELVKAVEAVEEVRPRPIVHITDSHPPTGVAAVCNDDVETGRVGARYFLERGFVRFAYAGRSSQYAQDRLTGYRQVIEAAGHNLSTLDPAWEAASGDVMSFSPSVHHWLGGLEKPVALLASNTAVGRELATACLELGLRVPEEVAILGTDKDERECFLTTPPLSTIDLNSERLGYEAAALLDALLEGEAPPSEPVMVQPRAIISRQSTDTFAIEDQMVLEAAHYIRQSYTEGITVGDVAEKLIVSRRSLERRFVKTMGRTVHDEIRRLQVERITELLLHTDLEMVDICVRTGVTSVSRLSQMVRQATGQSPRRYRQMHRRGSSLAR